MKFVLGLMLIALTALPARASIVCNGDSNTQSNWQTGDISDGWCEQLGLLASTPTINRGVGGSTIIDTGYSFGTLPLWGGFYIDAEALGPTDPFASFAAGTPPTFLDQPIVTPWAIPEIFIFAFGTNDIRQGYVPTSIMAAIKKYRQHVIGTGAVVFVATAPPMFNADGSLSSLDANIRSLNKKIRGSWPVKYVEFYEGFTASDFQSDGIHLNETGMQKRAAAAYAALTQ
jgi:hypothetical protein